MSDPAQLERLLSESLDQFTSSFKQLLHELRSSGGGGAAAGGAGAGGGAGTADLCNGFDRVTAAGNQTDIMQALLDASASFTGRSAILVTKEGRLHGWRGHGFSDGGAGVRGLSVEAEAASGSGPLAGGRAQTVFLAVGKPSTEQAWLIPLMVRERPVAALYADGGAGQHVDSAALALLVRTAVMRLEILSGAPRGEAAAPAATAAAATLAPAPVQAAPPPPPPPAPAAAAAPAAPAGRRATGPDLTNIPAGDHDIHKKAFRFAKLLVDELALYNKDKVTEGKGKGDVYSILQEDIDKSRLAYQKKFAGTAAASVDYFHQQMVAQVGGGDAALLGSGYPGPLV
jgi:hypothetical protein